MYSELVAYFSDIFSKPDLEMDQPLSDEARELYERGADTCLMYRGDSDTLIAAARLFLGTGARPYIYAGAAEVIICASYIGGNQYEVDGLNEAERFLKMAMQEAPNRFEIMRVQGILASMRRDARAAREILDTLSAMPEGQDNARLALQEIRYWRLLNRPKEAREWAERATKLAANNIQALAALNSLAGYYMSLKPYAGEALGIYQRIVQLDPKDAWAWHNMSYLCLQHGDLEKAGVYNRRALDIFSFGNAEYIRETLIKQWQPKAHKDPLDDVPRFVSPGGKVPNLKSHSKILRKLFGG